MHSCNICNALIKDACTAFTDRNLQMHEEVHSAVQQEVLGVMLDGEYKVTRLSDKK